MTPIGSRVGHIEQMNSGTAYLEHLTEADLSLLGPVVDSPGAEDGSAYLRSHPELDEPGQPLVHPVFEPSLVAPRFDEILHLHLLELPGPEDEVAGGDLVSKGLPDLGDPEGDLLAR